MADVQQALETIRDKVADIIARLESWGTLYGVCNALELPPREVGGLGKAAYLRNVTTAASDQLMIQAARQIINSYPGTREKPGEIDIVTLQHAVWWIESQGIQRISNVTRYRIAESLNGIRFWGRLGFAEFAASALPKKATFSFIQEGSDGFLYQTPFMPFDLFATSMSRAEQVQPSRISTLVPRHDDFHG